MKKCLSSVLLAPLVSEKTTRSGEQENSVAFWVNPKSTKKEIKLAVESFFEGVKVDSVNTTIKGRTIARFGQTQGQTKKAKKAYVKLAQGHQINFAEFEG